MTKAHKRTVIVLMLYSFIIGVSGTRTLFSQIDANTGDGSDWWPIFFGMITICMIWVVLRVYNKIDRE